MTAKTLSFSKSEEVWVATADSLGNAYMQLKRKGDGDIKIEQYIDGMNPLLYKQFTNVAKDVIVILQIPIGLKVRITSTSEVEKGMMIEAVFNSDNAIPGLPAGALTANDVVNNLVSDATDKPLSAAQGKVLKEGIPAVATPGKAGIVRQTAATAKPEGATPEQIKVSLDALIDNLKASGQMA